jgi:FkbM family methyltransferase
MATSDHDTSAKPQISEEDRPFKHYSLKHTIVAWISRSLFDRFTYTVRHGLNHGMKRKGGLGWVRLPASEAVETLEERFWRSLDLKGLVVYDVGAFQGTLTMFFASRCAHVVSYEPNSINHTRLLENLRLNALNNVTVRKLGVGASSGSGNLVFMPLMAGGGSLERKTVDQLKKSSAAVESERIQITTIDQDITDAGLPRPDFLKIDIEGLELEALKGGAKTLAAYRPALFLEMHGETLREKKRKVTEIVDWLAKAGYADVLHVETDTPITLANATVAIEGHLYCPRARSAGH